MVGDGGNGNPYKQTGRKSLYDCGEDGEKGEDCGNVNIYDSITVLAFGGRGGAGGDSLGSNSGGGAGGYPAAGIGRRSELAVAGGDHMNGGGGYTGGNRQVAPEKSMQNGMAGSSTQPQGMTSSYDGAGGSGYFEKAKDFLNGKDFAGPIGGRRELYQK